ncbi:MAG: phosphoribosylglycinamide formyltransferase [Candidatus Nanopelagicales bacterium]|nr:phosphoribosylglycinamide formyltransferase [Candidatus Nanopelagicales bacterium]
MDRVPVVALASGSGTVLQALIDACRSPSFPAVIAAVVADRSGTGAVTRAIGAGIPVAEVSPGDFPDRLAWDEALTQAVSAFAPTWIVSVGFMHILGPAFLNRFPSRIVNTHPALLPSFPGAHAVQDALAYGVQVSGCTVHLVDSGIDTGPVLGQRAVNVEPGDDEAALHERIKAVERVLLVDIVARLARFGCTVDGRKVTIP